MKGAAPSPRMKKTLRNARTPVVDRRMRVATKRDSLRRNYGVRARGCNTRRCLGERVRNPGTSVRIALAAARRNAGSGLSKSRSFTATRFTFHRRQCRRCKVARARVRDRRSRCRDECASLPLRSPARRRPAEWGRRDRGPRGLCADLRDAGVLGAAESLAWPGASRAVNAENRLNPHYHRENP